MASRHAGCPVTQGRTLAICHLDNDTVLVNKDTRDLLARRGTVFESSTPYTAHQNGAAESSNRMTETRSRNMHIALQRKRATFY
jgi:hypothetical protein